MNVPSVSIIGAGLAGSEAALVFARRGVAAEVFEMRPGLMTPAHATDLPAELVCSNSFKSDQLPSAHGLLKAELEMLDSPLLREAKACRVAAGSSLAVDRKVFSSAVFRCLMGSANVTLTRAEACAPPVNRAYCLIAAGPLASDGLTGWLCETLGAQALNFYDAIAPIVSADSVDERVAFRANRWQEGSGDYLNCPFTEEEYRGFYEALVAADRVAAHRFEDERFFEACLPVEVVAARGSEALAFGTMRPVGLVDPRTGKRPFAVCQLRGETASGESYNLVGFQTRLTVAAQKQVFRVIPGLGNAEFLRFGSIHRNTYLDSPRLLQKDLCFTRMTNVFLAGQICGGEGYTESIATGHMAALAVLGRVTGAGFVPPPATTACGALLRHVTASPARPFTPSNINFGLLDPLKASSGKRTSKADKHRLLCERALRDMKAWIGKI